MYLLAFLFPPLAVLLADRPVQAMVNLLMFCTVVLIPASILHGLLVVGQYNGDRRNRELVRALAGRRG